MDSDGETMANEDLGAKLDADGMAAYDVALEDGSSNENWSNDGEPPSPQLLWIPSIWLRYYACD